MPQAVLSDSLNFFDGCRNVFGFDFALGLTFKLVLLLLPVVFKMLMVSLGTISLCGYTSVDGFFLNSFPTRPCFSSLDE